MSVAKVIEIISHSKVGFEDAIKKGISKAAETVNGITSAWVQDQNVEVANGKVTGYTVSLKVTFVLKAASTAKGKGKSKS